MNLARDEAVDVQRLRRQVAFDRLLCRLFHAPVSPWLLKGGYAMELRVAEGRTTRDVDLALRSPIGGGRLNDRILTALQDAAAVDLGDFFSYAVGGAMQELAGAPYGGARYPVEARMDGRTFARFHVDVGAGDVVIEPTDDVRGRDWLGFAGIATRGFCAVAEAGSIVKAAGADPVRQSLMSRQIRELEQLFEVELVRRQGRGLVLTDAGRRLAAIARRQIQSLQDFDDECRERPASFSIAGSNTLLQAVFYARRRQGASRGPGSPSAAASEPAPHPEGIARPSPTCDEP